MSTYDHGVIWKLVSALLHHHDCVILPGFGGFVCNREPARIDQVTHIILPPGKRIVFNQNLRSNDGLLAGMLSSQTGISYNEAIQQIETLVSSVNAELQDKKQCLVEGFGSFRLNAEANYVFVPDNRNNFLYTSYGLAPVEAAKVNSAFGRERRTRIFKDRKETGKTSPNRRVRNLGPKALVLTLLIMLGANGWIYFRSNQSSNLNLGQASLQISSWFDSIFNPADIAPTSNTAIPVALPPLAGDTVPEFVPGLNTASEVISSPETPAINAIATPAEPVYTYHIEAFADAFAAMRSNGVLQIAPAPVETIDSVATSDSSTEIESNQTPEITSKEIPVSSGTAWYIIGGVFCKERNALRFREKLIGEGYKAEILSNSTIHCQRVSYSSYATKAEAESALRVIHQNENPEAWICNAAE